MNLKQSIAFICAQAAIGLSVVAPAYAADDEGGIAEVVVTAQKRSEKVQDVPISITAFTAEALSGARCRQRGLAVGHFAERHP